MPIQSRPARSSQSDVTLCPGKPFCLRIADSLVPRRKSRASWLPIHTVRSRDASTQLARVGRQPFTDRQAGDSIVSENIDAFGRNQPYTPLAILMDACYSIAGKPVFTAKMIHLTGADSIDSIVTRPDPEGIVAVDKKCEDLKVGGIESRQNQCLPNALDQPLQT